MELGLPRQCLAQNCLLLLQSEKKTVSHYDMMQQNIIMSFTCKDQTVKPAMTLTFF